MRDELTETKTRRLKDAASTAGAAAVGVGATLVAPEGLAARTALGAAAALPSASVAYMQGFREESRDAISKAGVDVTNTEEMERLAQDKPEIFRDVADRALQRGLANLAGSLSGNLSAEKLGELMGLGVDLATERVLQRPND
ncbi:hypothetical protein L2D14_18410 [Thalassospiraceae bacterium LMO-JJ14]|nr:hypothetical protein L2D14_18410 [Thalassospiraceae bacterium LMO-JJ14]